YIYRAGYKGLNKVNCDNLRAYFVNLGIACRIRTAHGVTDVEAVDSTQEFTLDDWQLDGESQRNDLLSHPDLLAIRNFYLPSPDIISVMRTGLNSEMSFDDLKDQNTDGFVTVLTGDEL